MAERTTLEQLDDIEERLDDIRALTELLLALRIIEDGHAANMREAFVIARNPFILNKLYPEPA